MPEIVYLGGPADGQRKIIGDQTPLPLQVSGHSDCYDRACPGADDEIRHRYTYERVTPLPPGEPVEYHWDGREPERTESCTEQAQRTRQRFAAQRQLARTAH